MKTCIECLGTTEKDGVMIKFRPATPAPDMHWAWMLMSGYEHLNNVKLVYVDNEPQVHIGKMLKEEDEEAFKHFMSWIRTNKMAAHIDFKQCEQCEGHPECIGGKK